jgi:hypothetical protein
MTLEIITLTMAAMTTLTGGLKPVDNEHFLIYGDIIEIDPVQMKENDAPDCQVVVYQDGEIYVAFNSNEEGKYVFNLPINHNYEIVYGGVDYVNKKIVIDAHNLAQSRYGHKVQLDMGIFKSYDGVDYSCLEQPVALMAFDSMYGKFSFDEKYSKKQSKAVYKCLKEIVKLHAD